MANKPKELPNSNDEYWEGEKFVGSPVPLNICKTHAKDKWMDRQNQYTDNGDGSITCMFCPWGCLLPGYVRCIDNRIVDLRNVNRG
jgi:hypothetical protein